MDTAAEQSAGTETGSSGNAENSRGDSRSASSSSGGIPGVGTPAGDQVPEVPAKPKARPIPLPGVHEDSEDEAKATSYMHEPAFLREKREEREKARAEAAKPKTGGEAEGDDRDVLAEVDAMDEETLRKQLKNLRGMHKSLTKQAEQGSKKVQAEREEALGVARAWKDYGEQKDRELKELRQRLDALERGRESGNGGNGKPSTVAAAPASPAPQSDTRPFSERVLDSIDWDEYKQIAQEFGTETADLWKDKIVTKAYEDELVAMEKRLRADFDSRLAPTEEEREHERAVQSVQILFRGVAQDKDPISGDPSYPELLEESSAAEITRIWLRAGWGQEFMAQPMSVHMAVTAYRDLVRYRERQGAKTLEEKPATDAEIQRATGQTVNGVATAGDIGGASAAPARALPARPGDAIRRAFRQGAAEHDEQMKQLGFRP